MRRPLQHCTYILVLKGPVPIVFVNFPGAPYVSIIIIVSCGLCFVPCLVLLSRLRSSVLVTTLFCSNSICNGQRLPLLPSHLLILLITIRAMPKAHKKKVPVTFDRTNVASSGRNPHTTRTIIRRFHVLLKRQEQLKREPSTTSHASELKEIEKGIEEMGGLAAYQHMSDIGQGNDRGGGSEKVFIKWLTDMGFSKPHGTPNRRRWVFFIHRGVIDKLKCNVAYSKSEH